jgi:hypothetical protein
MPAKPALAVLKSRADGASRRVHPGDDLEGWQVESVKEGKVVLTQGTQHAEIAANTTRPGLVAAGVTPGPGAAPGIVRSLLGGGVLPSTRMQPRLFRPPHSPQAAPPSR